MANKLIFLFPVFILQVLQLWTRLTECIPAVPSQAETANSRMHSLMAPNVGSRQWFHANSRSSNPHIQLFKSNESGLPSNAKDMLKERMPTSQSGERRIYTTWSSKDSTPNNDVGGSLSRPAFLQTRINVGAPNIGNGVYKTWSSENPSFQANGAITKSSDSPSKVLFKKHVAEPDISLFKSLSTNSPDLSNVQNVWFSGPSNGPDSMKGENGWLPASSNVPDSRNRKSVWLSGNINKSTEPMLQNLPGFPEINNVSDGRTSVFRTWSSGHPFSNEISHSIPSQVFYKVNNGNVTEVDKQTLSPWSSKDSYTRPNFENPHFGNLHHTDELNKATKAKFGLKGNNNKYTDERIETLQPFPYIGYQTDSLLNDTASENFHTMFDKLMTPTSIPSSSEHFINLPESIRKRIEAQRSRLSTSSANHPAEISYRFPPVSSVHNNKRKTTDNGRKKGSDIDRIFKRLPLPEFKRNHLKLSSLEIQDKLKNVVSDWIGNHSAVGQQKKNLSDTTKENQESTKVKNVNINANSTRIPASTETGKGTSEKNSRHFTLFPPIDLFGRTVIPNRKETNDGKLLESGHNRFKNGSPSPENAISERKKKNGDKTLSPSGKNVSENILKSPITVFKQQDNRNLNSDSHKKRKLKDEKMKKVSTIKTKIPENEQVRYYSDQSSESLINRRGQPRQSKIKKQVLKPKQNEKNMNEVLLSPLLERKTVKNDVSVLRLLLGPQINETLNADDKNATFSTHLVGNYQNRRDITKSTAKNKQNQKKRSSKTKTKSKEYPKNKNNLKTESPQDQRNTGNNSKSLTKETPGNNKVIQIQKSFPTDKRTQEVVPKTLQDGSQKLHLFNNSTANKERHRNLTKLTTIKAKNKETRINQTQNTPENTIKLPKGAKIKGNRTLKSNISTPYLPMSENTPKLLPKQAKDVGRREHKSNPVMTLKINRLNTTSLTKLKTREKDDQNQTLSTFITTNSTTKNTTNLISDAKVKGNTTLKSNVSITTADIIVNTTNLLPEQANEMDYREGNFTPITTTKKIHRNTTNLVRVKVHNIDHMNKTLNTSIITTLTTINRTDLITLTNENGNQTLLSNISTTNIEVTKNTTHVLPEQENDMNHKEGNSTTTAATKEKNQNVTRVITVKTHNTSITTTTTLNSTIKENNNITLTSNRSTSATENLRNKTKRLQENANGVDRNEQTSTAPTTVEEKLSKTTVLLPLLASRKSYKSNDSESKNDVLLSHLSKVTAKESIPKSSEKLIESLSYTHTPLSEMKVVSKSSETQKYVPTEIPTIRDSLKLNVEIKNEKGNKDKTIDLSIAKQLPNNLKKLKQRNKENGQHIYDSSKEIYAKNAKVKRQNETIASLDLEKMKTLNPINYSVLSKHENTSGEMNNSANYKTSDNTLSHFLAQPSDIEQKINTLGTERKELRMDNLLANYNTDTSLRPEVTNEMAYTGYTTIPTVTSVFKDPSHVSRETTESTNTNKAIAQNTTPIFPVARQTDFIVNSTKHKNYIFTKAGMKDSATSNIDLPSPPIFVKKNKESLPPIAESAAKNIELPPPPITLKKNIETLPPIDESAAKNIELPPPPITLKKNIETLPPIDEYAAKNIELPPSPITLKKNIESLPPIDEYAAKNIELPPSPIVVRKNKESLPPVDESAPKNIEFPPPPIIVKKNIESFPSIDTSSLYVFPELKQSQRNLKHLEMGTNAHINSLEPANNKQHLYTTLRKEPQHITGRREHVNDVKLDDQGSKTSKIKQISHRNEINREVQTSVKESRTSKKYAEERQQKVQSPVQPLAPSQRDLKTDVVKANVYDVYEVASSPKNVRHPNILSINQKPTSKVSSAKLLEKVLTGNTGNTIELFSLPKKLKERTRHVSTPNRPDNFAKSSSYTVNNYSSNIKEPYGKQDKKSIPISILELVYNNLPKIRKDLVPRKPKLRNTNVPKKSIVNFAPYKELTKGYATTSKILVPKAKTPQRTKKVKNSLPQRLVYPYTKDKRNTFELLQNEPKSEVKETDASNYFQKSQTSIKSPPYEPNEVGNIGHETRNGIHILNSLLSGGIRRGNKAQLFHVSPRADQQKASNVHLRRGAISVNEKPSFSKIINTPKKKLINTDLDTTKTNYLIRDMNVDQLRRRHNSRSTPLSSFDNRNTHTNKLTGVNSQGRADSNVNNIHRNANRSPNDWIKYFNIMSQQSPLANKIVLNRQLLDTTASKEQHQMFVDAAGKRKRNNKINTLGNFKNAQMLEPILRKYEKTDSETPKENSIQSSHSAYKVRQNIHHVNEKRQNDALPTKDAYLHDTRKARKTRVISLWDPAALLKRLSASEYNTAVENLKLPQ